MRIRSAVLASVAFGVTFALASAATATGIEDLEKALLAEPASAERAAELAEAYRSGNELPRGVAFLVDFHERNAPNALSLVWQGSLKTASSAGGDDMEKRLDLLQSGMADMDKAVRLFPGDARVRLVRGATISHFPAVLGMAPRAIADLEHILRSPEGLPGAALAVAREALARAYRQAGREQDADALAKAVGPGLE